MSILGKKSWSANREVCLLSLRFGFAYFFMVIGFPHPMVEADINFPSAPRVGGTLNRCSMMEKDKFVDSLNLDFVFLNLFKQGSIINL